MPTEGSHGRFQVISVEWVTGVRVRRVAVVLVGFALAGGHARRAVELLLRYVLREALTKKEGEQAKMKGRLD